MVLRVPLEELLSFKQIPVPVISCEDTQRCLDLSFCAQPVKPKNGNNGRNGHAVLYDECVESIRMLGMMAHDDGVDAVGVYNDENDECVITVTDVDPAWETSKHTDFGRDSPGIHTDIDYIVLVGEHGYSVDDFEERLYWERIAQARELEEKGDTYRAAKMYGKAGHARIAKEVQWKPGVSLSDLRTAIMICKALQ